MEIKLFGHVSNNFHTGTTIHESVPELHMKCSFAYQTLRPLSSCLQTHLFTFDLADFQCCFFYYALFIHMRHGTRCKLTTSPWRIQYCISYWLHFSLLLRDPLQLGREILPIAWYFGHELAPYVEEDINIGSINYYLHKTITEKYWIAWNEAPVQGEPAYDALFMQCCKLSLYIKCYSFLFFIWSL